MAKPKQSDQVRNASIWILVVGLLIAALTVVMYILGSKGGTTFTGMITAVDQSCGSDGFCSLTVDGKKVITGCAMVFDDTKCPRDPDTYMKFVVGEKIKVTANRTTDGDYSIECDRCGISKE